MNKEEFFDWLVDYFKNGGDDIHEIYLKIIETRNQIYIDAPKNWGITNAN